MARRHSITIDDFAEDAFVNAIHYNIKVDEAFRICAEAFLGGAPLNESASPSHQMTILSKAATFRAATPRRPALGKPLPKGVYEGQQELIARNDCQKVARRLILPKGLSTSSPSERRRSLQPSTESSEMFIRRLDAHREAPDAIIAPQSRSEDDISFIKRMVAVKANAGNAATSIILPKSSVESAAEFEARLALAQTLAGIVLPRGSEESSTQFARRLAAQGKISSTLLPRSANEPDALLTQRLKLQPKCDGFSIHPYDDSREDVASYAARLAAQAETPYTNLAPGAIRASKPDTEAAAPPDSPTSIDSPLKELAEEAPVEIPESTVDVVLDAPPRPSLRRRSASEDARAKAAAEAAAAQAVSENPVQETNAQAADGHDAASHQASNVERIAINKIGFMPLKKLLVERGVPAEQVGVANKMALKQVADAWADTLQIEWYEDWD